MGQALTITMFQSLSFSMVKVPPCKAIQTKATAPIETNLNMRTTNGVPLSDPTSYSNLSYYHSDGYFLCSSCCKPICCLPYFSSLVCSSTHSDYLQSTSNRALLLSSRSSLHLCAFLDTNRAGDVNDRKSTTGFSIFLRSSLIS